MNHRHHEAYGSVDISNTTSLSRRRRMNRYSKYHDNQNQNQKIQNNNPTIPKRQPKLQNEQNVTKKKNNNRTYNNSNKIQFIGIITLSLISIFILPSPFFTQQQQSSSTLSSQYIIITFTTIYCLLLLYILDLSNWKNGFYNMIWISFSFISIVFSWEECQCMPRRYNLDNVDIDGIQNLVFWKKSESWNYFILFIITLHIRFI